MFSADLFYYLRIVIKKRNNTYFKINGRLAYFKIENCTRELHIFFKFFKNKSLVVSQDQNVILLTFNNTINLSNQSSSIIRTVTFLDKSSTPSLSTSSLIIDSMSFSNIAVLLLCFSFSASLLNIYL